MRFLMAGILGVCLVGTVAQADSAVTAACMSAGMMSATECSCYGDLAGASLSDEDRFYVVKMLPGAPATQAVLDELAGDATAFMGRFAQFDQSAQAQCRTQ